MKSQLFLTMILSVISLSTPAQITTDGSLGSRANLQGPHFEIKADLGQQYGGNLFHSFQDFNLNSPESATFSGPNNVSNVISRVTGGNPSNIDGLIRSTMPNADMYFLNPSGIVFGPHARLDVQGSFHASTADYLRLGEGGRFDARNLSDSLLTVAPIERFGFLSDSPAALSIEGSQLAIPNGKTFSLVSGDITIKKGKLFAESGRFNLASIAQQGEIDRQSMNTTLFEKQGTITLSDESHLIVDGAASGEMMIFGGELLIHDSKIQANTLGEQNGQNINMTLNERIEIKGRSAEVLNETLGTGNAGNIIITTPYLAINQGKLLTNSFSEGRAGDIQIKSLQTTIEGGGKISSDSFNAGQGGKITLIAQENVFIVDKRIFLDRDKAEFPSQLSSTTLDQGEGGSIIVHTDKLILDGASISSNSHSQGHAGDIVINANSVDIQNGGIISAGVLSQSSGRGGNIMLNVKEKIHIQGFRSGWNITSTDTFKNLQSNIVTITFGSGHAGNIALSAKTLLIENQATLAAGTAGTGNAGELNIEVDQLYLKTGALISNSSGGIIAGQLFLGTGASGTMKITAHDRIVASGHSHFIESGLFSNTLTSGQGGHIEIRTQLLKLTDGAKFSVNSLGSGNAGNMIIHADSISLIKGGEITSSAAQATGGSVMLFASDLVYLQEGKITTSVDGGRGDGGNVTIENPTFVVLDKGQIKAQADKGTGGNIRIQSEQFIQSPKSLITASSRLGLDGDVQINSPTVNLDAMLVLLPGGYVEAQLKECTQEEIDNPSRFKIDLTRKRTRPFEK